MWSQDTQNFLPDIILQWLQEVCLKSCRWKQWGTVLVSKRLLFYQSWNYVEGTSKCCHVLYPCLWIVGIAVLAIVVSKVFVVSTAKSSKKVIFLGHVFFKFSFYVIIFIENHQCLLEYLHGHNLSSLCKSLLYPNTPASLQLGFAQRLLKAAFCFQFSKDKIWLPSSTDQRDANASQLSRFNFYFNPSFQSLTGLLFQLTSGVGTLFYEECCCICNTYFVLAKQIQASALPRKFFFFLFLIWGLSSGNVIPYRKRLVLWMTLDGYIKSCLDM